LESVNYSAPDARNLFSFSNRGGAIMRRRLIYLISFVLVLALAGNAFTADDPSLVIYYSFDDVRSIIADESGKGHDGTVQGNVTAEPDGKHAGAANFASGSYLDLDGSNFPAEDIPTSAMTLAAWVKCESTGEHHTIFDARTGAGTWIIHPELRSEGQCRWVLRAYGMSPIFDIHAGSVTWDEWLHYAGTYDKESGKAILYINGQVVSEVDLPGGTDIAGDWGDGARVGLNIDSARPFTGLMDDFFMFKRALSQSELKKVMYGEGWPYAFSPSPADGAMHLNTLVRLDWSPGDSAISHNLYLGENFDDVNEGAEGMFYGNQTLTYFIAGVSGMPYPDGLVPGTTYYWRIDELEADGTTHKGDVWSFTVPPNTAYDPEPANGAKFIDPDVELSWAAGFGAKLHTVYFDENFDDVNNAVSGFPQAATTYTPGTLELDKTYYWRIDEFGAAAMHKGDVWSFTTASAGGGVRADYYQGLDLRHHALRRIDPQIDFNWSLSGPDMAVGDDNFSVRWTGDLDVPISGTYSFYPKVQGGVRLWINDRLLIEKWQDYAIDERWQDHMPVEYQRAIYLEAGVYPIVMEFAYRQSFGGGAVVQLSWGSPLLPRQLIPQAALSLPVKANRSKPSNGAVNVKQTQILSWSPGNYAASHQLYFGTDEETVRNADTSSSEYKGSQNLGSESYDPGKLEWNSTYYWRVDEVNNTNPDSPWVGNLWSFTTASFLIVDDFEDYDIGNNEIWWAWKDGFGYASHPTEPPYAGNGTGAMVGDERTLSYTEETIVHGGYQSMPFFYDNSILRYSEAQMTLTYPRDWTENGVSTLSIWFRGDSANAPETLYVALNSSAVVFHDNPNAAKIDKWTQWNIDLQAFGVNLANVNTIALGLGNKNNPLAGGSGKMYFDDIRLYPPPPEPAPQAP
jgi:hypothetical protein